MMASLVRSTVLRQCLRQSLIKNQQRNLAVLSCNLKVDFEANNKKLFKTEFKNNQLNQFKRDKSFATTKILYTKDELKEKVMEISKKHEKVDASKFSSTVFGFIIKRGYAEKSPISYSNAKERVMLVLKLYDKIDPEKLTLESNFMTDLGLDSLDHVEIIMQIEDEFFLEILDVDAEKLLRPIDIVEYLATKEECYKEFEHFHDSCAPK